MVFGRFVVVGALGIALVSSLSCGGSSPTGPATATPTPVAVNTATPTSTPTSTPLPVGVSSCPFGNGTLNTHCAEMPSAYVSTVDAAITALTKRRPDIFNLSEETGPGQYRVLKPEDYMNGVVQELQAAGFCAESRDLQSVQLKKGNEFSERYAVLTSSHFVRRGEGSYRDSCRPAIFPVPDEEHIDAVRVHFFSIARCTDDRTPPDNAEKKLPLTCTGYVSATPKDKNNKDVDPKIHGPEVFWQIYQGEGENLARVSDFPGQSFNKVVEPFEVGFLTLCATVKGVRGCFGFDIIP